MTSGNGLPYNGPPGVAVAGGQRLDCEVQDLRKVYVLDWAKAKTSDGRTFVERLEVLKGITFSVRAGERIAIVGTSGAGKSTLLHLLGTLDKPSSGTISYGGIGVFHRSGGALARFRNENLGFIFQFHHLLPEFTALENVMMPAIIARRSAAAAATLAREVLYEVGLESRMEHRPGELSGGERQRVAVARAIVMKPSIILADEPTGNLDAKTGGGIHDLLVKLNETRGMSLITVTHNPDLARKMQRQIRLVGGVAHEEAPGTAMDLGGLPSEKAHGP